MRKQDIVLELIKTRAISVEMANAMLDDWATNHRFKLKISSFSTTQSGQPGGP